jgi:hypothetical protein
MVDSELLDLVKSRSLCAENDGYKRGLAYVLSDGKTTVLLFENWPSMNTQDGGTRIFGTIQKDGRDWRVGKWRLYEGGPDDEGTRLNQLRLTRESKNGEDYDTNAKLAKEMLEF